MTMLPVTSFFVALAAVALAALGFFVASSRFRRRVSFGDKGDNVMVRRIRTHGNFAEYVPLALLALALIEYQSAPKWQVWALGGALALSRALHAGGILAGILSLRSSGIILTFLMLIACAVVLLRQAF
jgi:uncharacterized membrane protein YecN with MAPEG domain